MEVRSIKVTEFNGVELLLRDSFTESEKGYQGEAELVKRIRAEKSYNPAFELVAVEAEQVLGHILMSEVSVDGIEGLALGPVAVRPGLDHLEVGTALIRGAEQTAADAGYTYISILGAPEFYGTPGYVPAADLGISASFEMPGAAFLIKELEAGALRNVEGTFSYTSTFSKG
ncbi:GNAT family N-acetyltransferase [Salinicoccus kekensis]|uniref:Predicted N-acetyltransferase YhbS n=1 Tax=Salinicoccus kekensis TaxID=714307 RepID=A0A285UWW6_9STAP|nr:N-acetyltransferase [Salinicoccus kekensis]SOC45216.1 predicted N-acetyltransferase YhbS [Salinicoccus kekensis]